MASGTETTATSYITHHLSYNKMQVGDLGTIHIDTLVTSVVLGLIAFGFLWWVVRSATSGVPNKRQAFVEIALDFIADQARNTFAHGDINKFVAPLALSVFVFVVMMNAMAFMPIDIFGWAMEHVFHQHEWRGVPTADVNTTFAMALSVWFLMLYFSVAVKGFGGWMHELFCTPFGAKFWAWPLNLLFNMVEYISKPLSHSLRLFGNMYAGEIIFLLLGMWAATGVVGTIAGAVLGAGWSIFHILIVLLQAYIFMMLTIVYINMAHDHH